MRRLVAGVFVLHTLLLALVTLALTAAYGRGIHQPRQQIAYYAVNARGSSAIFLHDVAAGLALPIYHTPHQIVALAWSPDGQQLAFSAYAELSYRPFLLDLETLSARRLSDITASNRPLTWTPDGSGVIFRQQVGPDIHLYRAHPASGQTARLLPDTPTYGDLSYTPDGDGIALILADQGGADLYTGPDIDGALVRRTGHPSLEFRPAWSPDGQQVAFVSSLSGRYEVYVMAADCAAIDCAAQISRDSVVPTELAWSPDGRWLVYEVVPANRIGSVLYAADMTCTPGDCRQQITPNGYYSSGAVWSPDGRWLVYQWRNQDTTTLARKSVDCLSCPGQPLTGGDQLLLAPVWRPP